MKNRLLFITCIITFISCSRESAWNYNDKPKVIHDKLLPEGVIIETSWTSNGLMLIINNDGTISKVVTDENLRMYYLVNDTLKH